MAGASRGLKENTESQFIKNKRIKRSIYKRGITTAEECPHHFGYLSQRPRHVELPEGCMTCVKLLECMTFEPNVETVTHQMKEAYDIPLKNKASTRKTRSRVSKQHEKTARKTEKKEPLKTLNNESETLPPRQELSECQLKVETLSIWDSLWSDTVRIDKEVLSRWGQKIELVEVEASDGENIRMIRCQVKPMESADKGVIQIPIRIQRALKIRKGEPVTVKPASN
jgi:hypothetical protein